MSGSLAERQTYARQMINENTDVVSLLRELQAEPKILLRYLWLMSEMAALDRPYFHQLLPQLKVAILELKPTYHSALASLWLIAEVPEQDHAQAIELLFAWIHDASVNASVQFRAILVLRQLCTHYPELKNELRSSIEQQLHLHSASFRKRAEKVLDTLRLEK